VCYFTTFNSFYLQANNNVSSFIAGSGEKQNPMDTPQRKQKSFESDKIPGETVQEKSPKSPRESRNESSLSALLKKSPSGSYSVGREMSLFKEFFKYTLVLAQEKERHGVKAQMLVTWPKCGPCF